MKLTAVKSFRWAHQGVQVEHFEKGQEIETDDEDLIEVATREGWVKGEKATKATSGASENK